MTTFSQIAALIPEPLVLKFQGDGSRIIRHIYPLAPSLSVFQGDILYVGALSDFQYLPPEAAASAFLLADDGSLPSSALPDHCLLFSKQADPLRIFGQALSLLDRAGRAEGAQAAVTRALFRGVSVQEMISLAARILGNPVLIQDTTTRLLAFDASPEAAARDEVIFQLLNRGFVTAELFQKNNYARVLKNIEAAPQAFLSTSPLKYDRIIRRLTVKQQYMGWVLTAALEHPFSDGDLAIMDFIGDALTILMERESPIPVSGERVLLLKELLTSNTYTEERFLKQAAGFSWKLSGRYFTAVLSTDPRIPEKSPRTVMAYKNHLSLLFPDMVSFFHEEQLVLFFDRPGTQQVKETLAPFLTKYGLTAAMSDVFHGIMEFPDRLSQASSVLAIGRRLGRREPLMLCSDYIMYLAVERLADSGSVKYYCLSELLDIVCYDKAYGTEYGLTIRTYMDSLNITTAAAALHIHRNTLIYRLEKIREISGLDITDPALYHRMALTFLILELHPEVL